MRPIRLELEGFTVFRNRTEVDFSEADLFVLSGPTGSGKSSVIDAITFALYGSVARYDDDNLVYPVVSQGRQEALVRFVFELNSKEYSVVRVVRRQQRGDKWNAVTKEARLECDGEVLAGSVKELGSEIQRLFGLSFDQFNTCVVLPQGEFATFLHGTPSQRQDILKELLGIKIYERMGQLVRQREANAKQDVRVLEARLKETSHLTTDLGKIAKERVESLKNLKVDVSKVERELHELQWSCGDLVENVEKEEDKTKILKRLRKPTGLEKVVAELREAEEEIRQTGKVRSEAESSVKREELALKELPDKTAVQQQIHDFDELSEKEGELEEAMKDEHQSREEKGERKQSLEESEEKLRAIGDRFEGAKRDHAAMEIARGLRVGDTCPVCQNVIKKQTKPHRTAHLSALKKEFDEAKKARNRADERYHDASSRVSANAATVKGIARGVEKLKKKLKKAVPLNELRKVLGNIESSQERLEKARQRAEKARDAERNAGRKRDDSANRVKKAWAEYGSQRDIVAKHDPPAPKQDDLIASWETLVRWRDKQIEASSERASTLKDRLTNLNKELAAKQAGIVAMFRRMEIKLIDPDKAKEVAAEELARAEETQKAVKAALKERQQQKQKLEASRSSAAIAGALANHLRSNAFERWVLEEAFERLRDGGSRKLEELSSGDYSFALDDQLNFDVIDHRNADEVRSIRTLSGGETFLASLSLALTLSEHVADMAAEGAAKLESIFLDEGFGALDSETLDTVATAIEELGSRGRVVGLVTHVKDLADRIPVQFRVTKQQNSSSIERVSI